MTELGSLLEMLASRLNVDESLELEFKSAAGGLPRDLWPTIGAFANTRGGWIVLGVRESNKEFVTRGVENPAGLLKQFFDGVHNPQKISHAVCGEGDASIEHIGEAAVVVVRVPAAPRRVRPVYINGNVYEGTYVRRHSGDYRCDRAEVARLIREASDAPIDATVLPHVGWEDLDRDTFLRFRRRFSVQHPADARAGYEDQRFLRAIGGWARDQERKLEGVTVAGLLMFGTEEAIREWRPRHLLDFRLLPDEQTLERRWDDRVAWEGNLLGAFEVIYPRLTDGLPTPFRLEGAVRVGEGPAQLALREALVNLLVHADYTETQASLVTRAPDGFFFRNPGGSRVPESELLTSERSDPRNPTLVRMFRFVGLAEESGTGLPRILRAWREFGFVLPDVDAGSERYEFGLRLRLAHLMADEDRAWLARLGGPWEEAEQVALVMARHEEAVDNRVLQLRTGLHSADVSQLLRRLRGRGLLVPVGDGRWPPYYCLGPVAAELAQEQPGATPTASSESDSAASVRGAVANVENVASEPVGRPAESTAGVLSLWDSPSSLGDNASNLGDKGRSLGDKGRSLGDSRAPDGHPLQGWARLEEIARPFHDRARLSPTVRDALVVQLCQTMPLSVVELVRLTARSQDHVRQIVRELVATKRLAYEYPDQPNHPGQRYLAP